MTPKRRRPVEHSVPVNLAFILSMADRLQGARLLPSARSLRAAALSAQRITLNVLVLGRFSVGKSTLINAFLGYPVLPGGMAPTTGVVCHVGYGDPGAVVRFEDGRQETFSGPEALQPYVSLNPQDPAAEGRLRSIVNVDLTLPLPLLRNGLHILDSPGLDEENARTGKATASLDDADIVLFVLAADQLMGEIEHRFLVREALPRGPGALALVINFWDRIAESDRPALLERLSAAMNEMGLHVEPSGPALSAGTGSPGHETYVFPLSASQALRARWRNAPLEGAGAGIIPLEEWLGRLGEDSVAVRERAQNGRLHFALGKAIQATEEEERQVSMRLAPLEEEAATRRADLRRLEAASARAAEITGGVVTSLQEGLSVRMAGGETKFRFLIETTLQKDPYDSLSQVKNQIDAWWQGVLQSTGQDAANIQVQLAGVLDVKGITLASGTLPPLKLVVEKPDPQFDPATDPSVPMKDTVAGLFGSLSAAAGDSAATWMNRASKAAAGVNRKARHVSEKAVEGLEASLSLAAYSCREGIGVWAEQLQDAVRGVTTTAIRDLRDELSRVEKQVSETQARLHVLNQLREDMRLAEREVEQR